MHVVGGSVLNLNHKGIGIFRGYSAAISRTIDSTCAMMLL